MEERRETDGRRVRKPVGRVFNGGVTQWAVVRSMLSEFDAKSLGGSFPAWLAAAIGACLSMQMHQSAPFLPGGHNAACNWPWWSEFGKMLRMQFCPSFVSRLSVHGSRRCVMWLGCTPWWAGVHLASSIATWTTTPESSHTTIRSCRQARLSSPDLSPGSQGHRALRRRTLRVAPSQAANARRES